MEKIKNAKRESRVVEFKETFNPDSDQDWCEVIKDIVAIANTGGGVIVFGIKNDLTLSEIDFKKILRMDSANITNKIYKYTNTSFHDFELEEVVILSHSLPALIIYESLVPMVFCRVGSYRVDEKTQKTAFSQGTLYFRHGAKSEPCNAEDMSEVIARNLKHVKNSWLGDIKKVVSAPLGSKVEILPSSVTSTIDPTAFPIRITTDESAPGYRLEDPNKTHPNRAKEVVALLSKQDIKLTSVQLGYVRKEYKIDETRPDFFYKPTFGSPQYSQKFVDWLVEISKKDKNIFQNLRVKYTKH